MSPEMKKAKLLLDQAYDLVGEDGLRVLLMDLGRAQLVMAVTHVYSDRDWTSKLMSALMEPNHAQIQIMCKLIDKLLPSPQAVKAMTDTPDQFIVQYTQPEEK